MNRKLKSLMQQLLQSPRRFPFEFALGIVFFIGEHSQRRYTLAFRSPDGADILATSC